jgi:hypothetical protein
MNFRIAEFLKGLQQKFGEVVGGRRRGRLF